MRAIGGVHWLFASSRMADGSALPTLQVNEREEEERDTVHCTSHQIGTISGK